MILSQRPSHRGVFFSFEGLDGSGKSTQAHLLAETLAEAGHTVVAVREPGGTPLGEAVRSLLLDPEAVISPRAEALLFAAARAQLVDDVIEPALSAGHHVIADRYVDSTTAYQGAGRGLGTALSSISAFATGSRMPDRTYLIEVSPEMAAGRRALRAPDRMELPPDDFHCRVASAYAHIADGHAGRVVSVDGAQPVRVIQYIVGLDARTVLQSFGWTL